MFGKVVLWIGVVVARIEKMLFRPRCRYADGIFRPRRSRGQQDLDRKITISFYECLSSVWQHIIPFFYYTFLIAYFSYKKCEVITSGIHNITVILFESHIKIEKIFHIIYTSHGVFYCRFQKFHLIHCLMKN